MALAVSFPREQCNVSDPENLRRLRAQLPLKENNESRDITTLASIPQNAVSLRGSNNLCLCLGHGYLRFSINGSFDFFEYRHFRIYNLISTELYNLWFYTIPHSKTGAGKCRQII